MALEGTLRDFSFADILQLISLQRKTGVLTLKHDANVVTISFLQGRIVGASSLNQHTEDRLGLILLKRGALTQVELDAALRRQEETLHRLGRILIDHHVVRPEQVRVALEQQILQIVFRVFRWSDGEYHFSQETDIDYDRDLMVPMAADSVIMEGARMTDEWPFIDQRIPDRNAVFTKVNPLRALEVAEEDDHELDDLGFSFTDLPEEAPVQVLAENRVTRSQLAVYELVDGCRSVHELILDSPLVEFETCKAAADLIDRGLIRRATTEEVTRELRREQANEAPPVRSAPAIPWLAIPFLVLLGFSASIMPHNPLDPSLAVKGMLWDRYVLESVSWFWMNQLSRAAETDYHLTGLYDENLSDLDPDMPSTDPWGRRYRLTTRGHRLLVTGFDHTGAPVPLLSLSRGLAWEGGLRSELAREGPGVVLLDG